MQEIKGDIWDYWRKPGYIIFITTNGYVKENGAAVMGRGVALQAKQRLPQIQFTLGMMICQNGNQVNYLQENICSFPVKHVWNENADTALIKESALKLNMTALKQPDIKFVLPQPGCGNGKLNWEDVRPLLTFLPDNVYVISPINTK